MSKQYTAVATAKVTVEFTITNLGSWGPECTIAQADGQAREMARAQVANALRGAVGAKVVDTKIEVRLVEST